MVKIIIADCDTATSVARKSIIKNNADYRETKRQKKSSVLVIKNILEGETDLSPLNSLNEILAGYDPADVYFINSDVNLFENLQAWYNKTNNNKNVNNTISIPLALLDRTRKYINDRKVIKQFVSPSNAIKHFISLNAVPKLHRFQTLDHIFDKGYQNKGHISWLERNQPTPANWIKNAKSFDGKQRILDFDNLQIDQNHNQEIMPEQYNEAMFDFVLESVTSDTSIFITEKTWKPLLHGKMFLAYGPKGMYKYLKSIGFEMYEEFIDYSFDELDVAERYQGYLANIDKICNLQLGELKNMFKEKNIIEKVRHNIERAESIEIPSWEDELRKRLV